MTSRPAYMYGPGINLAPTYPWDGVDRFVKAVIPHEDGTVDVVTNDVTYHVPFDRVMKMPMRIDGSVVEWDSPPRVDQLCIGDRVSTHFILTDMYTIPGAVITTVGLEFLDQRTGSHLNCIGMAGRPVMITAMTIRRSARGETIDERSSHPERGPYADRMVDGVTYYFYVHPTGRGRWPADIPVWTRQDVPGEYRSRPIPRYGKGSHKLWSTLEYTGTDASLRHPNDPLYSP